jgi:hypothetical protein
LCLCEDYHYTFIIFLLHLPYLPGWDSLHHFSFDT